MYVKISIPRFSTKTLYRGEVAGEAQELGSQAQVASASTAQRIEHMTREGKSGSTGRQPNTQEEEDAQKKGSKTTQRKTSTREPMLRYLMVDQIDKKSLEISQADDEVYTDLTQLGDELPDHSPRYILLSYPLTMVSFSPVISPLLSSLSSPFSIFVMSPLHHLS